MVEPILAWTAFAVVLVLCLPFRGVRKLILEASGFTLRIALLALLAGGAFLWFRPDLMPTQVVNALFSISGMRELLPPVGSPQFGLVVATVLAAVFLPLLAILDVTRRLTGWTVRYAVVETTTPVTAPAPVRAGLDSRTPAPQTTPRRHDRRAAAEKMAEIGSRRPFRVADDLR